MNKHVTGIKKQRRNSCGDCGPCNKPDCGVCSYCLDKPKFGGAGKWKKLCKQRVCIEKIEQIQPPKKKLKTASPAPPSKSKSKSKSAKKSTKKSTKKPTKKSKSPAPKSERSVLQKACKECSERAVAGNYGYCLKHRDPETKEIFSQPNKKYTSVSKPSKPTKATPKPPSSKSSSSSFSSSNSSSSTFSSNSTSKLLSRSSGGIRLCKKCSNPAIDGNYGWCLQHRDPSSNQHTAARAAAKAGIDFVLKPPPSATNKNKSTSSSSSSSSVKPTEVPTQQFVHITSQGEALFSDQYGQSLSKFQSTKKVPSCSI